MKVLALDRYSPLLAANSALSPRNPRSFSAAIVWAFIFVGPSHRQPKCLEYLPMESSHTHNPSHLIRSSRARVSAGGGGVAFCYRRAARVQDQRGEVEVRWGWAALAPAIAATAKGIGIRRAATVWECKRQRLLLLLRRPCPSQKASSILQTLFIFPLFFTYCAAGCECRSDTSHSQSESNNWFGLVFFYYCIQLASAYSLLEINWHLSHEECVLPDLFQVGALSVLLLLLVGY